MKTVRRDTGGQRGQGGAHDQTQPSQTGDGKDEKKERQNEPRGK